MGEEFQTLKEFMINILAGIFLMAISWGWSGNPWLSILILGLFLISSFIIYPLFKKYRRLFKLIKTLGDAGYYYSFDPSENSKVFDEVRHSFCYLG